MARRSGELIREMRRHFGQGFTGPTITSGVSNGDRTRQTRVESTMT
jgi:hypothetical protein